MVNENINEIFPLIVTYYTEDGFEKEKEFFNLKDALSFFSRR